MAYLFIIAQYLIISIIIPDNFAFRNSINDSRKIINVGVVLQRNMGWKYTQKEFKNGLELNKYDKEIYEYSNYYKLNNVAVAVAVEKAFPMNILNALCDVLIKQNVVAIFYPADSESYGRTTASSQYFMHLASYTGIPIIAWNADNSGLLVNRDLNKYRLLQMAPTLEHQANAMMEILMRYKWKKFAVLVSSIAGGGYFSGICSKIIRSKKLPLEIVRDDELKTENASALHDSLHSLQNSEARIFLLYATTEEANVIFQAAAKYSLTDSKHMWIVTQSVVTNEKNKAPSNYPVGMMATHFNTKAGIYVGIDDIDMALYKQTPNLIKVFKLGLDSFLKSYNYSIDFQSVSNCDTDYNYHWHLGEEFYKHLIKVKLAEASTGENGPPPTIPLEFDESGYLKDCYISILNLKADGMWEKIGDYFEGVISINDISWPGGMHLPPLGIPEKYQVKVVTLDEPPFVIVSEMDPTTNKCPTKQGVQCQWGYVDGSKNNNDTTFSDRNNTIMKCCSGYCVDLLIQLSSDLGFEFDLYKVPDGRWGTKENKKWNGLVRELVDKKADLCVTSLKINSEREKDIDISIPFLDTGITILVAHRGGALSPTAFLEPFEFVTWVFILVISIQAAGTAIFIFEWLSPQSYDRNTKPPRGHKFSLCRSLWLVWATLFSASVNTDVPRSYVARFMALVWAAFSLTFIAVYTANLAAFMITKTDYHKLSGIDDPKITTPHDWKPPFRYGTVLSGNTDMTLRNNYESLYRYMKVNDFFKSNVAEGLTAVKKGEYDAFIYDSVVLQYLSGNDDNCEIGTVGKWFSWTGYGIGFPKKSKWLTKVNEQILKYQDNGYLEQLRNFWLTGACSLKVGEKKNHSSRLGIENFVSAFVLLCVGIGVCLIFLFAEFFYCNYLREKLSKCRNNSWLGLFSLSMGRSLSLKEAAELVHQDYKIGKAKSIWFNSRREKYLETELQNVMSEIFILSEKQNSRKQFQNFDEEMNNIDEAYSSFLMSDSSLKLSDNETLI